MSLLGFAVVLTRASIVKTPYTLLYKDRVLSSWCLCVFRKWRSVVDIMEFLRSGLHQNLRVELFNFCFHSLPHYCMFELCYKLYFEKTSDTTLNGSYISPKQHFDNIEDFKVTEEAELFQNY